MPDSTRKQLADALRELLPGTWEVHHYPKSLNVIGDLADGTVVVERRTVAPAPTTGSFDETFWIWVVTGVDDEELAEDALDAALEEVQGALAETTWCTVPTATREMYGDLHAYRLETAIKTTKE